MKYFVLLGILALASLSQASAAGVFKAPTAQEAAQLPRFPAEMPADWLSPSRHPRLVCDQSALQLLRKDSSSVPWIQQRLVEAQNLSEPFLKLTPQELSALVPKPGSTFFMKVGNNTDPIHRKPLTWAGWKDPGHMLDRDGNRWPNEEHPDDGKGWTDPKSGQTYFFVAQANTEAVMDLEEHILPALADVFAFTGSMPHANAAATLLDALAAVSAGSGGALVDSPYAASLGNYKGRLHRATFGVARSLSALSQVIDLVAASGALQQPSNSLVGKSIAENLARNLLWDMGSYCLLMARQGGLGLSNGQMDVARGSATAGLMLSQSEFWSPLVEGPASIDVQIANNVDKDGCYYENALGYEVWTLALYLDAAELVEALRKYETVNVPSIYGMHEFAAAIALPYEKRQIGGHYPATGNNSPDLSSFNPRTRIAAGAVSGTEARAMDFQILCLWRQLVRAAPADAARAAQTLNHLLAGRDIRPPSDTWSLYHISSEVVDRVKAATAADTISNKSAVLGGKGLVLLRGGEGEHAYGSQMFFGPLRSKNQLESLSWLFYSDGTEWSFDPGRYNAQFRFGWCEQSVAHQAVVFDRKSVPPDCSGGALCAFLDSRDFQWAAAVSPQSGQANAPSLTRVILQATQPGSGELGYWIDTSFAVGGGIRDDSFHTIFKSAAPDFELKDSDQKSLYGKENLALRIRPDYTLEGTPGGFYGVPDGYGYGFLGHIRQGAFSEGGQVRFTHAGTHLWKDRELVAFLGGSQSIMECDGPGPVQHPAVPYFLRREEGAGGPSIFAKLIQVTSPGGPPSVSDWKRLPCTDATGKEIRDAAAFQVSWKGGERDVVILRPPSAARTVIKAGEIETNGLVSVCRYDAEGKLLFVGLSEGTEIRSEGKSLLATASPTPFRVTAVTEKDGVVKLTTTPPADSLGLKVGQILLSSNGTQIGHWTVAQVEGDQITLSQTKTYLARSRFTRISGQKYALQSPPSMLLDPQDKATRTESLGRKIEIEGEVCAEIKDVSEDFKTVTLQQIGPKQLPAEFTGKILEIAPGDTVAALSSSYEAK